MSGGDEHAGTRLLNRPRALLTGVFCAFAAFLPVVGVVAPKGTVVLLLLVAVLAVPIHWWTHRRFPVPDLRIAIALSVLVVWCAIASAWSEDSVRSLVLALRVAVIFTAGLLLIPIVAALDDAARKRIGLWLIAGFGLSLALVAVETGLDYPMLRIFKTAETGKEAVWFNRGAVALALLVWPVTALLWARGLGWKALALPAALGVASLFLESAAATLCLAAGVITVLLALCHRRAGLAITVAAGVLVFVAMPFAAREMHNNGWHQADWLAASAQHRVEIWDFSVQRMAEKPLLGWGFDGSRHMGSLYPDPGDTGRGIAALHPHNAPLQIMLELGAVGAVIVLALLWFIAMRLDDVSGRSRTFGQVLFVAALAVGSVAYGTWQNWWLALLLSTVLLVSLTSVTGKGNSRTLVWSGPLGSDSFMRRF
ncbi:MAG: hypothetical protein OXB97_11760 [Rhodospirillales bacterium]|nr:hypothetical protein [Rhodospirillales bacterium]